MRLGDERAGGCRGAGDPRDEAVHLGGQHLIGLHAMRHEVAEGAAHVHGLIAQMTGDPAPASPLVP